MCMHEVASNNYVDYRTGVVMVRVLLVNINGCTICNLLPAEGCSCVLRVERERESKMEWDIHHKNVPIDDL